MYRKAFNKYIVDHVLAAAAASRRRNCAVNTKKGNAGILIHMHVLHRSHANVLHSI